MNYSYKRESQKKQTKKNETLELKGNVKRNDITKNTIKHDNSKHSIMNLNLVISLSQHPTQTFQTNLEYGECDFQRINEARNLAQKKLKQAKVGTNVKISESANIQHQDCAKLMNFVIGGYGNDFNEYLSLNEFNEKREDFTVLNTIYKNNLDKWKRYNKRNPTNKQQTSHQLIRERSLLELMNLNENSRDMTRARYEELLRQNKMVQ